MNIEEAIIRKEDIEYEMTQRLNAFTEQIARVICEKAPFQPSVNGRWGVNPLSLFVKR